MVNYLRLETHPSIKHEVYFEIIRDQRKGGLNPDNYSDFLKLVNQLPPIVKRTEADYSEFEKLQLSDISDKDKLEIEKRVREKAIEISKKCWHPLSGNQTCKLDSEGKILVSAAHSIQENGILKKIASDNSVMCYKYSRHKLEGNNIRKNIASIFWGFCNSHDAIFYPIENGNSYQNTPEQNFLFAYRAFTVSSHKKLESSYYSNFDIQANIDMEENKKIFDNAILNRNFDEIETEVFELSVFYPFAASSSFYLDFDFETNPIHHSDERMEDIYVTFFPATDKSFFLLSYLKKDKGTYGKLGQQIRRRNNLKSDLTMLIAGHAENVFFEPTYYKTFIEKHEERLIELITDTQFDDVTVDAENNINVNFSLTPINYLLNPYEINFFGY